MLTQMLDKWPDFLEVHRDVEDGPLHIVFVCVRKNSRAFQTDQLALLRVLEEAGQRVVVRVGTQDLTLDQFERSGAYTGTTSKMLAQSTFYNKQAELRRYEAVLEKLPFEDPSREAIVQRVSHLKAMLGVASDATVDKEAVAASDAGLRRLEKLYAEQDTDENVMKIPWLKIEPGSALWKRKLELFRKQEEKDAASKSTNAGEGEDKTNEAQRDAVDSAG